MEAAKVLLGAASYRGLVKAVGTAILLEQLLARGKGAIQNSTLQAQLTTTGGFLFLFLFARAWLGLVDHYVPEPYLVSSRSFPVHQLGDSLTSDQDEFFHIPQAQVYCEERYLEWDDKITTPPGL